MVLQFGDEQTVTAGDENIVNVDEKDNGVVANVCEVEVRVCLGLGELPCEESSVETCVPGMWTLAKSVKGFVQLTD